MRLVVGLGNPGAQYARTRHNVAWWVLDTLAARHGATPDESNELFVTRRYGAGDDAIVLLQPLTYMNLSGDAVAAWRSQHAIEDAALLVVSDDVYLPVGTLRLRGSGSSGGHRGLESIEIAVGGTQYARLRVGVGEADSSEALREHVLEGFSPEEQPAIDEAVRRAADAVDGWVAEGLLGAMNRFNRRVSEEESPS